MGIKRKWLFRICSLKRNTQLPIIVIGVMLLTGIFFINNNHTLRTRGISVSQNQWGYHLDMNGEINALRKAPLADKEWDSLLEHDILSKPRIAMLQTGRARALPKIVLGEDFQFKIEEQALTTYRGLSEKKWDILYTGSKWGDTFKYLTSLKPHQLVNHIPGLSPIISKPKLNSLESNLAHVKKSFYLPHNKEEFLSYHDAHPGKKWLRKGTKHRGIYFFNQTRIDDLRKGKKENIEGKSFILQEFLHNPFLINNRKFDLGVHGAFTSANPLRAYADFGDWNIKFCLEHYEPFDETKLQRFIEGQHFMQTFEEETLAPLMAFHNMTRKDAFLQHFKDRGYNTTMLEDAIMEALIELGAVKDAEVNKATEKRGVAQDYSNKNFFEFIRFDFALDSNLRVWIIEANMGPVLNKEQLHATKPYIPPPRDAPLDQIIKAMNESVLVGSFYRNILRSMFTLVGAAQTREGKHETSQISDWDINVNNELCRPACRCSQWECKTCWKCLDSEDKIEMKRAYIEHFRRGDWRRFVPRPFKNQQSALSWRPDSDPFYHKLTERSQKAFLWFRLKCLQKEHWCS